MGHIQDIGAFSEVRERGLARLVPSIPRIAVGMGTCGRGNGAAGVYHAFVEAIDRSGNDVILAGVGCFGPCFQEPIVNVRLPGAPSSGRCSGFGAARSGQHSTMTIPAGAGSSSAGSQQQLLQQRRG